MDKKPIPSAYPIRQEWFLWALDQLRAGVLEFVNRQKDWSNLQRQDRRGMASKRRTAAIGTKCRAYAKAILINGAQCIIRWAGTSLASPHLSAGTTETRKPRRASRVPGEQGKRLVERQLDHTSHQLPPRAHMLRASRRPNRVICRRVLIYSEASASPGTTPRVAMHVIQPPSVSALAPKGASGRLSFLNTKHTHAANSRRNRRELHCGWSGN